MDTVTGSLKNNYLIISAGSIQPINLPSQFLFDNFAGEWSMAAGYGKISDRK
jgi:hypothetical protein